MKKIVVQEHWAKELQKLRCWISGWKAGRSLPGGGYDLSLHLPGEDVLRQIIIAIDDTKVPKK